jgi:hypothetical protein
LEWGEDIIIYKDKMAHEDRADLIFHKKPTSHFHGDEAALVIMALIHS